MTAEESYFTIASFQQQLNAHYQAPSLCSYYSPKSGHQALCAAIFDDEDGNDKDSFFASTAELEAGDFEAATQPMFHSQEHFIATPSTSSPASSHPRQSFGGGAGSGGGGASSVSSSSMSYVPYPSATTAAAAAAAAAAASTSEAPNTTTDMSQYGSSFSHASAPHTPQYLYGPSHSSSGFSPAPASTTIGMRQGSTSSVGTSLGGGGSYADNVRMWSSPHLPIQQTQQTHSPYLLQAHIQQSTHSPTQYNQQYHQQHSQPLQQHHQQQQQQQQQQHHFQPQQSPNFLWYAPQPESRGEMQSTILTPSMSAPSTYSTSSGVPSSGPAMYTHDSRTTSSNSNNAWSAASKSISPMGLVTPGTSTSTGGESVMGFAIEENVTGSAARFATEEGRWDAILRRSHSADSHFVYGALTTRIYCRPSCASKRPERSRVQFFAFPDAAIKAESAGFRACKRCKPGTQGTADMCVLAVGDCLRHMTRAALLGESDDVDKRLRRRTLKQYSNDYGVSAFHFHRTLKAVCTLTPGDYTKICHSLALQDNVGMDRYNRPLDPDELSRTLRGWSARRARRALGNVLPQVYSTGVPDLQTFFIVVDHTKYGRVVIVHTTAQPSSSSVSGASSVRHGQVISVPTASTTHTGAFSFGHGSVERQARDEDKSDEGNSAVLAVLLGPDAAQRATLRFPHVIRDDARVAWLQACLNDLAAKGTREVQMPAEVIPWVRRARIYLAAKNVLEPHNRGSPRRGAGGRDDTFDDDDGFMSN